MPLNTEARSVPKISPEQLEAIMNETRPTHRLHRPVIVPVPTHQAAGIFFGLLAGAIVGWVLLYGAAVLVRVLAS